MITESQMRRALKSLYSTYPNAPLSDSAVEEWLCIFEKYELPVFEQAFRAAKMQSGDFLPSPGLVMKEIRELGGSKDFSQTKEWIDYPNGDVAMKITTNSVDDKGKQQKAERYYVDSSPADKWKSRKKMYESGLWLCVETIDEKRLTYSYQNWHEGKVSSQYKEGGHHQFNGESLPFLATT